MMIQIDDFVKDRKNASYGIGLAIREAIEQGADTLRFGSGEYHLGDSITIDTKSIAHDDGCGDIHKKDCHILLRDIQNLTICGSESERTLLTGFNSGRIQELLPSVLWAENCRNLTIKNLGFSRKPETAFGGVVERIEKDTVFIKILSSKDTPEELGAYCMNRYDIGERKLSGESLTFGFGYEKHFHRVKGQEYSLKDKNIAKELHAGEGLSFHQSGKTDFLLFFGNCHNLKLENIQIENTNGFALLTENCEHITADKVRIAPPENQFFTGPRDGWKIYRCSGKIKVENSHFEGVRMDGQNVQSNYLIVEKIPDEKTLLCKCKYAPIPLKNDSVIYFREEEPERIMHIEDWKLEKGYVEEAEQAENLSAGTVVTGSKNHISFYRIKFKEKLPCEVKEGSLLTAGCWEPEEYICRNSVFRNIAGAGHLIRCKNAVLEHNRYENIMCAGIMLGAELDTHCESDHVSGVLIRNNYFRNIGTKPRYGIYGCACIGIKSQGFQGPFNKNIRIEDNIFEQSNRAIEINDAKDVQIRNNTYRDIKENIWINEMSSLHIVGKEEEQMIRKQEWLKHLYRLYKEEDAQILADRIEERFAKFQGEPGEGKWLSEKDSMLITYGDSLVKEGESGIKTLHQFMNSYVKDAINTIHILPMFPYTSDDGFSVVDYKKINPDLGDWKDIGELSEDYRLMFDAVVNHMSKSSEWFQKYLKCEEPYKDFFITSDPDADYSKVTRPRALPLLTEFDTAEGKKHVWTTFSDDQIDLNFACPDVMLEMLDVLLTYAENGARFIRLDAIGFLWKELGTSCMHLPETHEAIKLMRKVLEDYMPGTLLITETNVPYRDNMSYFGNGDEAHLIYQFPLPPLTMFSLLKGDASKLSTWAKELDTPAKGTTYFNFLSSHDGIGVRPAEGILTKEEQQYLVDSVLKNGGSVSYKDNGDGTKSPYELNINYQDALASSEESDKIRIARFLAAETILLSLQGLPGIYIHSLLGSRNDYYGKAVSGIARRINREKLSVNNLEGMLSGDTNRKIIFEELLRRLNMRKMHKAFSPDASQNILTLDSRVFALERYDESSGEKITILINVSGEIVPLSKEYFQGKNILAAEEEVDKKELRPYETCWIVK